ncbi:pentapeptide repeat-containing protein [Scytonema hofmannii]|uniref:pentapeptide repeat-containing protein n=1 Tax=Scytonema hofmannii TaxID=34078 RepID=UPI00234E4C7F|nr:pentapeptide repeat-containing protein [Scytonema hofmannii]
MACGFISAKRRPGRCDGCVGGKVCRARAKCGKADLGRANPREADITNINLDGANLQGAILPDGTMSD